jgi:hypothetical protein
LTMKILGPTMERYLVQVIFRIILVLYTIFIATKLIGIILVENISGVSAKKVEVADELRWSLIGKNTMDRAQNLRRM